VGVHIGAMQQIQLNDCQHSAAAPLWVGLPPGVGDMACSQITLGKRYVQLGYL